jgi:predicted ferric reductase
MNNADSSRMISMIVPVAFSFIAGFWLFITSSKQSTLFNKTRAYFTVPALFGGRQSEPLPWKIGYVPARSTSTIITIYIVLNVIFNCVDFRSVQPSSWYTNRDQEMAAYVGNRAGVLSFANMALAMLFSTRNNPLSFVSGWSPTTFIALHRWAARISVIQAVVHSIAYTADFVSYTSPARYPSEVKLPYFWWGIIATVAMSLMAGLSILPLRRYSYELFLVGHIALAILSLLGCWYHIALRFDKDWGYEVYLYIAFAFWAYDRLVRFGRLVSYSFLGGTSHGQVEKVPGVDGVVSLKLYPSRPFNAAPGQHTFVYFPGLGRFWENHPFTVAGWGVDAVPTHRGSNTEQIESSSTSASDVDAITSSGSSTGKEKEIRVAAKAVRSSDQPIYLDQFYVKCLFRVHGGTTSSLNRALASRSPSTILSEGAYGGHSPATRSVLGHAERVLVIAGGIGITFATAYAKQYTDEHLSSSSSQALMPRCTRMHLVWSVREANLLTYVRRELLPPSQVGDQRSLEYSFHVTGDSDGTEKAQRRMNVDETMDTVLAKGKKIVVLVCGPGGLADDVRRGVVRANLAGYDVELLEESFAW